MCSPQLVLEHCCFQRLGRIPSQAWHHAPAASAWDSACRLQLPLTLLPLQAVASAKPPYQDIDLALLLEDYAAQLEPQIAPLTGLEELPAGWLLRQCLKL